MGLPRRSPCPVELLSARQREVLELVTKGLTNSEIGSALHISSETVRTHLAAIFARLEVTNRTEAAARWLTWNANIDRVARVLERPAIAVLPLLALDDARSRTVAIGLTRDLAIHFTRWCWFPVIAHTSTRDARSLGTTSRDISHSLGARFLVDGALRASSETLRLTVSIVDGESDLILWTDARDFPRRALFDAQDEVCRAMVAAAYPVLVATVEAGHARTRQPKDLTAWELAHHALQLHDQREHEANRRAQVSFRDALDRDPTLVLAHYGLGLACYDEVLNQWGTAPGAASECLYSCAARCIELAPHMAEGHYLLSRHLQTLGAPERAIAPLEAAIGHNPSFAAAHALLAQVLVMSGRTDDALARMKQACRLGPRSFVAGLAVVHFVRCEYAEALAAADRAIATNPRYPFGRALAAASAWWLGDVLTATAHARALAAMQPRFDPARFLNTFGPDVDCVARVTDALSALSA